MSTVFKCKKKKIININKLYTTLPITFNTIVPRMNNNPNVFITEDYNEFHSGLTYFIQW